MLKSVLKNYIANTLNRRMMPSTLLLAALLSACGGTDKTTDTGNTGDSSLYIQAKALEAEGQYSAAADSYRRFLMSKPSGDTKTHAMIKAVVLEESINYGADDLFDLFLIAINQRESGDWQAALLTLDKMLQSNPSHYLADDAHYLLAYIQLNDQHAYEVAYQTLGALLEQYPGTNYYDTAVFSRGIAQKKLGNTALAETHFQELQDRYTGLSIDMLNLRWPQGNFLARLWFTSANEELIALRSSAQVDIIPTELERNSSVIAATGDLPVGIMYYLWHCAKSAGKEYNITRVLNDHQSSWGPVHSFHWWDEPTEGYYCLGDQPDVISRHLKLLRDAGIDFLVIDITNHPNTYALGAETLILKSLRPLLEAARTIPNAPKIVPWVPFAADNPQTEQLRTTACNSNRNTNACSKLQQAKPMHQHVTNWLSNEFSELTFEYKGKPLLLETSNATIYLPADTDIVRPHLENNWTVRPMWGLRRSNDEWQFLSTCSNPSEFFNSNGWAPEGCNQPVNAGEQISVTAAYQYTYISEPFKKIGQSNSSYTGGMPKFHGRTMAQQFRVAFEDRDNRPLVLLTGWNEWIAQRFDVEGRVAFVDLYDSNLNRDIEPGGSSGDLYYYLMRDLITQYRNHEPFSFEDYFLTKISILDTSYYWETYTDLQSVFDKSDETGLSKHWLTVGIQEGRSPSVVFNASYYRNRYADLTDQTAEALLNHFIDFGFQEGREGSSEFHAPTYLGRYSQVARMYGNNGYYKSFKYYVNTGQLPEINHNPRL